MGPLSDVMGWLATPRSLAALVLLYGLLAAQGGRGTLAYFTSSVVGSDSVFTAGRVDISASTLASGTGPASVLTFSTSGTTGADCALSGTDVVGAFISNQPMTPGVYCSGKIAISNSSTVDSWLRLRVVRTAPAAPTAADISLNDKLKLYMREVSSGTVCAATRAPSTVTAPGGGTLVSITTATAHGLAAGDRVNFSGFIDAGLATLNGSFTVASSPAPTATGFSLDNTGTVVGTYTNGARFSAQWTATSADVFSPTNATNVGSQVTRGASPNLDGVAFGTGGLAIDTSTGAVPSEANMDTAGVGTINAANLIGNDSANADFAATGASGATVSAGAGGSRYFCVAVHLPSATDLTATNNGGDNTVVGGTNTYAFVFTAAQKSGRP